ncbi:DNA-binding response regulator [Paucibacter sp. KBW04]|nr:DNA-binding response regulator [Paucibacter sp. KBW04]
MYAPLSTANPPERLAAAEAAAASVPPLILLVDDKPEELRWLNQLLQPDFRLALAHSGQAGLQRAQALQPDLVLLDIGLPDMDGYALCRLLKSDPLTRSIPVLFLSAHNAPERRIQGLSLGAVDFIAKPFHPEEVLARVHVHLRLAAQIRQPKASEAATAPPARNPDELLVQAAAQYIRAHLSEMPSVAQIARQVGLHEKRLLALFREHLGQTISGFIRDERVSTGQRLLADTAMSVQDIAFTVGFGNPGNFATSFRERTGMSPQAYRQALREPGPT